MSTRSANGLTLKRTHNRTRHGEDLIHIERQLDPLRHVLVSLDDREEEIITQCLKRMKDLEMSIDLTLGEAEKQVKGGKRGYRSTTTREAYRRYKEHKAIE